MKKLKVPVFSQADNASGQGYKECMTSSCAMLAAFYGKCRTDDEYAKVRRRFGETTDPLAQVHALGSLGLIAEFRTSCNRADIVGQIEAGRPIACGWLHHGHVSAPSGGGHWSVVAGASPDGVWMIDPNGECALVSGGYLSTGRAWSGWYSWRNWLPRWDARKAAPAGQGSSSAGWAITVQPLR
jgi:hypothetical protein